MIDIAKRLFAAQAMPVPRAEMVHLRGPPDLPGPTGIVAARARPVTAQLTIIGSSAKAAGYNPAIPNASKTAQCRDIDAGGSWRSWPPFCR